MLPHITGGSDLYLSLYQSLWRSYVLMQWGEKEHK